MNPQLKTILLTVLTLSLFTIALVELSVHAKELAAIFHIGISNNGPKTESLPLSEAEKRIAQTHAMPKTVLSFMDSNFNFGNINEGDIVKHAFHFRNIGTAPLLIGKADVSCGCTVPSFPKEPIPPGGEGDILVQFDSHHKKGPQHKSVLIYSNSVLDRMSISFDANVD